MTSSTSSPSPDSESPQRRGSSAALLHARVALPVLRRVYGILGGRHESTSAGRGQDFEDLIEYRPGDDVAAIDWKATARAGAPIIRRFEHQTNINLVLAVDTGRSMGALAPSLESKEEIALAIVETVAFLARMRGDRIGLVAGDSVRMRQIPARTGNAHVEALVRYIESDIDLSAPVSNMQSVLERVHINTIARSIVIIITDEVRPEPSCESILRKLCARHSVLVLSVADVKPTDLPVATQVVDVEAGALPSFVLEDPELRRQAHIAATKRKDAVSAMLRYHQVPHGVINNSDGVVDALVNILGKGVPSARS